MLRDFRNCLKSAALTCLVFIATASAARGQGAVLAGAGPINRSMAGAATAAPLDPAGALYWNPATTAGLSNNEVLFGMELLYNTAVISSTVAPGAFGPGAPAALMTGQDSSDGGLSVLPTVAMVYRPPDSGWTYGFGVFVVGGFFFNYPGDLGNPIVAPRPPNGFGAGPIFSNFALLQVAPSVAYQVTDHLAVGFSPTVDAATLQIDPTPFASPDDANGDGFATRPAATHTRIYWGLGFQVGLYYTTDCGLNFGVSFKSPQWFETIKWNSADELGRPRRLKQNAEFPMIPSLGVSYTGIESLTLAVDVRYIDFADAKTFGDPAMFDVTGRSPGVGWDSVISVAAGVQYVMNENMSLRLGYSFNENPIRGDRLFYSLASAPIYMHTVALGASYKLTEAVTMSMAVLHAFRNEVEGPYQTPAGPIPGTSVGIKLSTDTMVAGFRVKF